MKKYKKLIVCWILILVMALSVGCSKENNQNAGEGQVSKAENTEPVVVRLAGGDYGLSQPYTTYSRGPGTYKVKLVFDTLVAKDDKGYIPWLAEKWEAKEEGKQYVFTLRDDVKWADGTPFTAEDVVFTFKYAQQHPPVGSDRMFSKKGLLEDVVKTSEDEVTFNLSEPNPNFIEGVFL